MAKVFTFYASQSALLFHLPKIIKILKRALLQRKKLHWCIGSVQFSPPGIACDPVGLQAVAVNYFPFSRSSEFTRDVCVCFMTYDLLRMLLFSTRHVYR